MEVGRRERKEEGVACVEKGRLSPRESCLRLQSDGAFFSELSVFSPRSDERSRISDSCAHKSESRRRAEISTVLELQIVAKISYPNYDACEEYCRFWNYKSIRKYHFGTTNRA